MKFAVVDLETTGGTAEVGRITEIGIVLLDDCEVVKTYSALVDPGMPIQPFVQNLTGITDEMVRGKPQFASIAEEVAELLRRAGCVCISAVACCLFLICLAKTFQNHRVGACHVVRVEVDHVAVSFFEETKVMKILMTIFTSYDEDNVSMPRQHLQKSDGRICDEGPGQQGWP